MLCDIINEDIHVEDNALRQKSKNLTVYESSNKNNKDENIKTRVQENK